VHIACYTTVFVLLGLLRSHKFT